MGRKKKKSFMTPKASRRKARKRLSTTTGRVKKEFTYRGFSMEDLSQMELWPSENSEISIIELLPSRARRSIGRGMSKENALLECVEEIPTPLEHTEEICQSFRNLSVEESQFTTDKILLKSISSLR